MSIQVVRMLCLDNFTGGVSFVLQLRTVPSQLACFSLQINLMFVNEKNGTESSACI